MVIIKFSWCILFGALVQNCYGDCSLKIAIERPPIILNSYRIVYPSSKLDNATYKIKLLNKQGITLICPLGGFTLKKRISHINLKCKKNKWLSAKKVHFDLSQAVQCSQNVNSVVRPLNTTCGNNYGEKYAIGFEVGTQFISLIIVCYDLQSRNPLYTLFRLNPYPKRSAGSNRPQFDIDKSIIQLKNIDAYYKKEGQNLTFSLLGADIYTTNSNYLAKGHLAANNDFVWSYEQRATFHLMNAVPQWQSCNNANWKAVENAVRNYTETKKVFLNVYTGSYGTAQVPKKGGGSPVDLYLYADNSGRRLMPVPAMTWKLVYNPFTRANIVLFTINNPYKSTYTPICTNVLKSLNWLNIRNQDKCHGYTYACLGQDVYNTNIIRQFPNLNYGGILN